MSFRKQKTHRKLRLEKLEDKLPLAGDFSGEIVVDSFVKLASELNGVPDIPVNNLYHAPATIGDFDGDGIDDLVVSSRGLTAQNQPGSVYIHRMNSDGTVRETTSFSISSPNFGTDVAAIGDLDGDGVVDLAVGSNVADGGNGAVFICFLNSDGSLKNSTKIGTNLNGGPPLRDDDIFGQSVAVVGDLDDDGITEIIVGANGDDLSSDNSGAAYLFFMNQNGTARDYVRIADGVSGLPSGTLTKGDSFGYRVEGLGDLNQDGVNDIAVQSPNDDGIGAVYVLFLSADGSVNEFAKLESNSNGVPELDSGDSFGRGIGITADLDGDGVRELVAGASGDDTGGANRGAIYALYMNSDGTVGRYTKIADGINGGPALNDGDNFGDRIATIGDLDSNGFPELAILAYGDDTGANNQGAIYVSFLAGANSEPTLDAINDVTVLEDDGLQVVDLSGITDGDEGTQALSVTAASNNADLVPNPTVNYTSPDTTGSLSFTPLANCFGSATITVTVEDSGSGTGAFESVKNYSTGQVGRDMALTDLNGDGELDAVIVDETPSGNTVAVLLGEGDGVFGAASHYLVGDIPYSVVAGDFNEDGHVDVATVNGESEDISVLLGDGTGVLGSATFFAVGSNPQHIDSGDIDNDGHLDLIVSNHSGHNVSVLTGLGDGSFNPAINHGVGAGSAPQEVLVTDIDQDGVLDIVTANCGSDSVGVLLGNNDGTFSEVETFGVSDDPFGIAVGDFNNDGLLDLAASTWGSSSLLSILLGTGSGSFGAASHFDAGPSQFRVAVADFDSDGNQDVVVSNAQFSTLSLLAGNGDGTFGSRNAIDVAREPNSVLVADLNKDGFLDIATSTNFRSESLSVLLGIGGKPGTFSQTFEVTVNPVNDPPVLGPISDLTINEDASEQIIALNGILAGGGESQELNIVSASSNTKLIPTPTVITSPFEFDPISNFEVGDHPQMMVSGDFNNDGIDDLAVGNLESDSITIRTGIGDGSFTNWLTLTANNLGLDELDGPSGLASGDFDQNGTLDLVVTNYYSGSVASLFNHENESFKGVVVSTLNTRQSTVKAADVNGDHVLDLVILDDNLEVDGKSYVRILTGNGNGTFNTLNDVSLSGGCRDIVVADFNDDSIQDLVITNSTNAGNLYRLNGNGDGTFSDAVSFSAGHAPFGLATGDFNEDKILDLAVTDGQVDGQKGLNVLMGIGNGQFGSPVSFEIAPHSVTVEIADFNFDGHQDIVVGSVVQNNIALLIGDGNGDFSPPATYPTGNHPVDLAVSDYNNDGKPDIAVANRDSDNTITFVGSQSNKLSFTPVSDQFGESTITVTVEDGGLDNDLETKEDNLTTSRSFLVTVDRVNDEPLIDVVADLDLLEDASEQTVNLSGIIDGDEGNQPLSVTASSSLPGLIPDPVVDYTSPDSTGSLSFTALADQFGTATITVTVEDGGFDEDLSTPEDNATTVMNFLVNVAAANDLPTLDAPAQLDFSEAVTGYEVNLSGISPGPSEDQPVELTVTTDNEEFLSDLGIDYTSGPNGTLTFSTPEGELGRGNLFVTIEDGGLDHDLSTPDDNASVTRTIDVAVTAKKRTYALSDQTVFGEVEGTYRDTYWKNQYSQSIKETLFRAYKRSRLEHHWEFDLAGADVSMEFFVTASHDATNEQFRFQYQVEGSDQWKLFFLTTQNESKQYYARIVDPDLAVDGKVTVRVVDTGRQDDDELATVTVDRIFFLARRLTNMDEAVNVLVFDPEGAEGGGNKAQFRFQLADRNRLDHDVEVFYELSGTSENSDYREVLRGTKTIKAGNLMTRIFVTPKSDTQFEGAESVTVRILESEEYRLTGDPEATVMIHDQDLVTLESYGEVTNYGSHDQNYQQSYYLDDQWETVTEEVYAGGNRTRMDHRWKFDLTGESEVVLKGRFEITSEADQDDFQVVYSVDGSSWKTLGRLKPDAGIVDLEKAITLPEGTSEVWVRMFDRYRKNGDATPTTVAIDHLCFQRVETLAMPPVMFFPPAPQMMLGAPQVRRPVSENLFSLLGQGDDELRELLEDQDPQELEAFYRQWQSEDQDSLEFSQWLEDQWAFVI